MRGVRIPTLTKRPHFPYHGCRMSLSIRVLMLLLILGGGDPLGLLFVPAATAASPTEEDESVESVKAVVQIEQVRHHRPRSKQPIPFLARIDRSRISGSGIRPAASTAFLAAINSPLNC
jgi:hypothetical protein